MSEKDRLSFTEGEEEEFHITDDDIDRELAAMETDQSAATPDGAATEETIEKPSLKNRLAIFKQLKRKHWLIIAIIVLMLLFGLIKMLGSGQSQASFDQITPVMPTHTAAAPKNVPESASDLDVTTAPTMNLPGSSASKTATTPGNGQLTSNLTAIAGNEAKLTEALTEIQQQNKALTQQLSALSDRVVGLESVLSESNQTVQGLSQQVGTLKNRAAPAPSAAPIPQQMQTLPEMPQYTTQAVVPQRAWVQTSDGNTITVTIGETLPGLGAVIAIDPYTGNVTTASGTVIKYGN